MLRRNCSVLSVIQRLDSIIGSLRETGADVLAFTLPDPVPINPIAKGAALRLRNLNLAVRDLAAKHGAYLVDLEAHPVASDRRLSTMGYGRAIVIGSAQILALFAGISRDGVTMVTGMRRGLSREDAVRFAFLLSTPVIFAAGVLKIPDLFGPLGQGIGGPILLGSILSFIGAYAAIRFLVRYLRTNTLYPFGIYCLVAGLACVVYLGFVK